MLDPNTSALDKIRTSRCLLAFITDDKAALDAALDETAADEPHGTPGLMLAALEYGASCTLVVAPNDPVGRLRLSILENTRAAEG